MSPPSSRTTDANRGSRRQKWLSEPLVHFLLIGALLFAIDHFLISSGDTSSRIVVSAKVDELAQEAFRQARGHAPNAEELQALRQRWVDNEVLYREGLALQLDKGDTTIRDRVIFKTLSIIEAKVKLPEYDDGTLRAWFEKNRARYDEPARYDFLEAVPGKDHSESAIRSFVAALNAGTDGNANAGLRVFKGRPFANIEQSYGTEFAQSLKSATTGQWHALRDRNEWRAIRLQAVVAPRPAEFEQLRNVIVQDWTDATMAEQRSAEVARMARKYSISFTADPK
ncbi:peptidyl-prolyl cis-trans isomerase [Azoarcus sp. L1K30]|uniref:peptidylprolyl isomerase n=1 Tax=Azoarcus sp. L1K30 TaxID=2820277 RepID=UPI001B818453|nr:peptidylprolyl isomerase [Azoarcus sp. L1K30]MBR0566855.1 peptidyl-prolyl cis-trans isomerase [Azoarcus sp. L1K30]